MTRKYILTGAPGSGKSSIILALEMLGEHTIREAAEDVIKYFQAQGIQKPWELPNFQNDMLNLQIQREQRIKEGIERVFIDRGIPDGLAYTFPGTEISRRIQQETRRYDKVFLIENLGRTETNAIRRENHEEALRIELKIEEVYTTLGYKIIRVPSSNLMQRTRAILTEAN